MTADSQTTKKFATQKRLLYYTFSAISF